MSTGTLIYYMCSFLMGFLGFQFTKSIQSTIILAVIFQVGVFAYHKGLS